MSKWFRNRQNESKSYSSSQTFKWIGFAAGALIGAVFGGVEYGEPWLGALVGTGLAGPIAWFLRLRNQDSA